MATCTGVQCQSDQATHDNDLPAANREWVQTAEGNQQTVSISGKLTFPVPLPTGYDSCRCFRMESVYHVWTFI
jgi:hypothetical protein